MKKSLKRTIGMVMTLGMVLGAAPGAWAEGKLDQSQRAIRGLSM